MSFNKSLFYGSKLQSLQNQTQAFRQTTVKKQVSGCDILLMIIICNVLSAVSAKAQFAWAKRVASTVDQDAELAIGMTVDNQGNSYETGWFDGTNDFGGFTLTNLSGGGQDIFVAKYDSNGTLQWAQRSGGSSANRDAGRGIGGDANGNIYVTGGFYGPADFGSFNLAATQNEEFFLIKYDSAGTVQWAQQSVDQGSAYGTGLAVDSTGNSYAVGFANGGSSITFGTTTLPNPSTNGYSAFLVKYDNSGEVKWAQLMGGPGQTYATKASLDTNGNVYVNGSFTKSMTIGTSNLVAAGTAKSAFFAKFDTLGNLIWVQQPQGDVGNRSDGGVAVDQDGNVYATGAFDSVALNFGGIKLTSASSSDDAFVAKYDNSGAIQWVRQTEGTNFDFYLDVALDRQGNIYTAGILNAEAAIVKYDSTGTVKWAYSASGLPANPVPSLVEKCAVDSAGNCYLAGWYQGAATFGTNVLQPLGYWNFFLAKVAPPAPPTLGIALHDGVPQLSLAGAIGGLYSVQWSPILATTNTTWQILTTFPLTNSPQFFLDTTVPTGPNRFYRESAPAL